MLSQDYYFTTIPRDMLISLEQISSSLQERLLTDKFNKDRLMSHHTELSLIGLTRKPQLFENNL